MNRRAHSGRRAGRWARATGGGVVVLLLGALGTGPGWAAGTGETARAEPAADPRERQVQYLAEALAESRARVDALTVLLDRVEMEDGGEDAEPGDADAVTRALARGVVAVDVNRELGMVVLNAGRREGFFTGMVLAVMRNDQAVARVRVVDVRGRICGAVVEKTERGAYPRKDDRVLMESRRD